MKNRTLLLYACFYLAFLYLPVLVLPLFSFNNSAFIAFPLTGFTIRWYAGLADSALQQALVNSLKVGIATALLSTLLGLLAAKAVTQYRLRGRGAALGMISLPLFIPDIVLGISLLLLLGTIGLPLSLIIGGAGASSDLHVPFRWPFWWRVSKASTAIWKRPPPIWEKMAG
jgi:spermidine/putrescine transport system permease protein